MGEQVERYIRSLRRPEKRDYATRYVAWKDSGERGLEPARPASMSAMGAQAVRITLAELRRAN